MAIDWWWKLMKSVFRWYQIKARINRVGKAESFEGNPKMTKVRVVFCVPFLCIFFSFQNKIHWNNYQNKRRSKTLTLKPQQIRKILKQQKSDKKKIPSGFWRHKATNLRTMVTSSSLLFTHFSVNQFVSSLQPRSFWPTATGIYAWVALLQKPRSPLWAPTLRGEGILGLEAHWKRVLFKLRERLIPEDRHLTFSGSGWEWNLLFSHCLSSLRCEIQ